MSSHYTSRAGSVNGTRLNDHETISSRELGWLLDYDVCHEKDLDVYDARHKLAAMSTPDKAAKLSSGEMEIMKLLWEHGPLTINEAHQAIGRPIGYTTVQTRLNRLVEKGAASRSTERPAKYEAAISPDSVSADHLDLLVDRVASGSVVPLVAQLLSNRKLSADEITELERLIAEVDRTESSTSDEAN